MKKPQDPRKHGLVEPKKDLLETRKIKLSERDSINYQYGTSSKISLDIVLDAWEKEKSKLTENMKVVEGPFVASEYTVQHLMYTVSTPNPRYEYELAVYNAEVSAYKEKLEAFETFVENRKKGIEEEYDKHIFRLEQKIANLKARKANEPIPFPEA